MANVCVWLIGFSFLITKPIEVLYMSWQPEKKNY